MYEVFELRRIVEKIPLTICAIATWDNTFILSTVSSKREAHCLVYQIREDSDPRLTRTLKKYTAQPVTQLAVSSKHNLLLGLTGGDLVYADLESYTILGYLPKRSDITCFAVDWHGSPPGYDQRLRVCIPMKKKLQIYHITRTTQASPTLELINTLTLPNKPRDFIFVGDGLLVCIKKTLFHVTLDGERKELFDIGATRLDPCLQPMMNGNTLVLRDEHQFCFDPNMRPLDRVPLTWSGLPSRVVHVHPYVIGQCSGVEVRALDPKIMIQTLKAPGILKFMANDRNTLVASRNEVFKLEPKPYEAQASMFVSGHQFELALQISDLIDEPREDNESRRDTILRRFAFHQFSQHKFQESLQNYIKIKEDPLVVIGLYPHLLPSHIRWTVNQSLPTRPPGLSGENLEEATKHLISYLTQMRYTENRPYQGYQKGEQEMTEKDAKKLAERLQIIDTTLLKCYAKTNNTLLGSLVRLPDNYLDVAESERVLRNEEKFKELVDLYKNKKMHGKALTLLAQFSWGPLETLRGVRPTIDYLQALGSEFISLILQYSTWVIEVSPSDALWIFTEDIQEVVELPRDVILRHLENNAPFLCIPYLWATVRLTGSYWSDFFQYTHLSEIWRVNIGGQFNYSVGKHFTT